MAQLARHWGKSFVWFVASGLIGFVVDAGLLTILMRTAHVGPLVARAASFPAAVTVTWLINRQCAFAGRGLERPHVEYGGYLAIQVVGAAVNLGVFLACLKAWPQMAEWPVLPLAAGAAIALAFNFGVSYAVLYSRRRAG